MNWFNKVFRVCKHCHKLFTADRTDTPIDDLCNDCREGLFEAW